ncbi:HET-domain-containing protein [Amniculicola lignicola CBS 123094]|uniref:HET-domain-containing protein n=1 Tax=Amniculicola lignicola CBS 123094 TaxID=1392246 RepID=A0A6A5WM34_9PLEO|nr:HET-domain-containing protein [Amniculicola lignicola CBS 123094]
MDDPEDSDNSLLYLAFAYHSAIWLLGDRETFYLSKLLRMSSRNINNSRGHMIDPEWIDIRRLQKWIRDCDRDHSGQCHSVQDPWLQLESAPSIVLIDVQSLNLEGAFEKYKDRLPATVRDSIALVASLGQQYLWVDRFCIIQDDVKQKSLQIKHMAAIYANAYITIIAASGNDDEYGLRGAPGSSQPRGFPHKPLSFSSSCGLVNPLPAIDTIYENTYYTRGWTFQEERLSRRRLCFREQTASWTCGRQTWEELERFLHGSERNDIFSSGCVATALSFYENRIRAYSFRHLTFNEDALQAFSAITTVASRSLVGGLLFGIPEALFDGCLLWRPRELDRPVTRRTNRYGGILREVPSWSWAGWTGRICTYNWKSCHRFKSSSLTAFPDTRKEYIPQIIESTVKWHKEVPDTGFRMPVRNWYYGLPEDGDGHKIVESPSDPLPIEDDIWSPILSFRTTALVLSIGLSYLTSELGTSFPRSIPPSTFKYLIDKKGVHCGTIYTTSYHGYSPGQQCELISVSKGSINIQEAMKKQVWED